VTRSSVLFELGEGVAEVIGYGANDLIDATFLGGIEAVTLTQLESDTLVSVGDDQIAILKNTLVSAVNLQAM